MATECLFTNFSHLGMTWLLSLASWLPTSGSQEDFRPKREREGERGMMTSIDHMQVDLTGDWEGPTGSPGQGLSYDHS